MDGYTLSISRCSGGDGVEESFKAKIKRREAALDAFAVAEAYCKESWMVSNLRFWTRCRRAAEALPNGLKYAAGGRCVITDTFTGEEKIWRVGL